jgi:hypothetical protein
MSVQQSTTPAGESKKDGEDLTTILDKSQRADLTLLIANVSESMRQLLIENFDASAGLDNGLLNMGKGATDEEKLMNAPANPATADVDAYDRERKLLEQYEKDLASTKMRSLKKDALKAFDDWRENVLQRVGQVVNSQNTTQKQLKESKSDSGTRDERGSSIWDHQIQGSLPTNQNSSDKDGHGEADTGTAFDTSPPAFS